MVPVTPTLAVANTRDASRAIQLKGPLRSGGMSPKFRAAFQAKNPRATKEIAHAR